MDFLCEVALNDSSEEEVYELIRELKARFGDRVRTRTLVRSVWELERRPVPPPLVVRRVFAPRHERG